VAEDAFIRLQPPLINPRGIVDSETLQQPPLRRGRLISIYALNSGGPNDAVRVWIGDRPVAPEFHGQNLVSFRLPEDAPALAAISVEVNGSMGNAFTVATR
jgi:hypothetical protein